MRYLSKLSPQAWSKPTLLYFIFILYFLYVCVIVALFSTEFHVSQADWALGLTLPPSCQIVSLVFAGLQVSRALLSLPTPAIGALGLQINPPMSSSVCILRIRTCVLTFA